MELTLIQKIAVFALPVIFAITLHEAAHGYVARFFGDMTAAAAGRITVNPLKHIDPVGTILVPLVILLTSKLLGGGMILFGWAKPVPVNFGRLRRPKQDMLWVAAAGPGMNFVMAVFWALMIQLGRSEERRVGKSVDLGGRRIIKKKREKNKAGPRARTRNHRGTWSGQGHKGTG